jgi:antitoxin (DNA-binding transcriptional repressor) of toxin-antitoxin stability system
MESITVQELKADPSKVLDEMGKSGVVVTRDGKPAAMLVYMDEDLLDDFIIAHHPTLMKELEEARQEYLEKGGMDLDTVMEELERRSRSSKERARRE